MPTNNRTGSKKSPRVIIKTSPSNRYVLELSEYKNKRYVAFRQQYAEGEGEDLEWKPGRQGLNLATEKLTSEHADKIAAFFSELAEQLRKKGR